MVLGHLQLRARRVPKADFPLLHELATDLDGAHTLQECHKYVHEILPGAPVKPAKRLLVAMANGGSLASWLQKQGASLSKQRAPASVEAWGKECRKYHALLGDTHPALLKHFKDMGKWYPECSVTCALDRADEATAT
eukprot:15459549-Alexandrium_andersonii.AAC.1